MEVYTRPDADEDNMIDASFKVMEPLVKKGEGLLTISVIEMK